MKRCALCDSSESIHVHHVIGRVGKDKNKPENLIDLCWECHFKWHNQRSSIMESTIYSIMKQRHGDKFPVKVNGKPYMTKWIIAAEERINGHD